MKSIPETCPHCGTWLRNANEDGFNFDCGTRFLDDEWTRSIKCIGLEVELIKSTARAFLATNDEETGTIDTSPVPSCPICTLGTVPNSLNKGLCARHLLEKLIAP